MQFTACAIYGGWLSTTINSAPHGIHHSPSDFVQERRIDKTCRRTLVALAAARTPMHSTVRVRLTFATDGVFSRQMLWFPTGMSRGRLLQTLNMSSNSLKLLPAAIATLTKLKTLRLDANRLEVRFNCRSACAHYVWCFFRCRCRLLSLVRSAHGGLLVRLRTP